MISINFTLVLELIILFLFFIISRNVIWKPLLQTIKQRNDYFDDKTKGIELSSKKAQKLREEYQNQLENAEKAIETRVEKTIHEAYNNQRKIIEEEQRKSRELLNSFRNELQTHYRIDEEMINKHAELLAENVIQCIVQQKRIF
ncbi:MAG TPA: hypothetical protein PLX23_01245 [Candidatus Hydrogenedens sp.]|nr:hypothetical protein [Candidatus Hydrogenedens sp.]